MLNEGAELEQSSWPRWGADAYLSCVVLFAVYVTYVTVRHHYTAPHADDWLILDAYFSTPLLEWLWVGKSGHRIPATYLLLALDYTFFLGRMHLLVAASVMCTWLSVFALYLGFRGRRGRRTPGLTMAFAFSVYGLFWAAGSFDLVWGMNQGTRLTLLWLFLSPALLLLYGVRDFQGSWLPVAAAVAAVLATFSHAIGAVTWVTVTVVAIVGRLPRRVTLSLIVAGIASVAAYASDLKWPGDQQGYPSALLMNPFRILESGTFILGEPIRHAARGLGWTDGPSLHTFSTAMAALGLLGLTVRLTRAPFRPGRPEPVELFALSLMCFAAAGCLLVALARTPWLLVDTIRFISFASLFWIGAAALWLTARNRIARVSAVIAVPLLSLAMLPALGLARAEQDLLKQRDEIDAAMHLSGIRREQRTRVFAATPDLIHRVVDRLEGDRRSIFAGDLGELRGSHLSDHFARAAQGSCKGRVDSRTRIQARGQNAAEIRGFGWDRGGGLAPRFLVIADSANLIVGLGVPTPLSERPRPDGPGRPPGVPWVAFIGGYRGFETYDVYGVREDGRSVCRLARLSGGKKRRRDSAPRP